jgi:hypothetical protein
VYFFGRHGKQFAFLTLKIKFYNTKAGCSGVFGLIACMCCFLLLQIMQNEKEKQKRGRNIDGLPSMHQ